DVFSDRNPLTRRVTSSQRLAIKLLQIRASATQPTQMGTILNNSVHLTFIDMDFEANAISAPKSQLGRIELSCRFQGADNVFGLFVSSCFQLPQSIFDNPVSVWVMQGSPLRAYSKYEVRIVVTGISQDIRH